MFLELLILMHNMENLIGILMDRHRQVRIFKSVYRWAY